MPAPKQPTEVRVTACGLSYCPAVALVPPLTGLGYCERCIAVRVVPNVSTPGTHREVPKR